MIKTFNTRQVAEALQCSIETVKILLRKKALTGFKLGAEWRVTEEDLERFIEDRIALNMGDVRKTPVDDDSSLEKEDERYQKAVKEGDTITQTAIERSRDNRDLKKKTRFMADFAKLDEAYPKKEL